MLKLSIVIPVYQVEKYIRPCLESVFRQGLDKSDFEVIIVNDGTKDRSMEVAHDIICQHDNVSVIRQENQGLSVARNNGISQARGEYILMPDSDDLLMENSLMPLLELALKTQADLVVADFLQLDDQQISQFKGGEQPHLEYDVKTGEQLFLDDLNPNQCYVWRTLYRRQFLIDNNLTFVPGIRYEDVPFTHECYLKAQRCVRTNWLLNIYRRGHSSTTSMFSMSHAHDFCIAVSEVWKLTKTIKLSNASRDKLMDDLHTSFSKVMFSTLHSIPNPTDRRAVIDLMLTLAPDLAFSHGCRQKAETFILRRSPHFYMTLREWHWSWIRRQKLKKN